MSIVDNKRVENLYGRIAEHVRGARSNVMRAINLEQVRAYWLIGRDIVEYEQHGEIKAEYGKQVLQYLSDKLRSEFGSGFGIRTVIDIRKFYIVYQTVNKGEKTHAVRAKSCLPDFKDNLSWTHYRSLMGVKNAQARSFYEIEASKNNWSSRELNRQIGSLLFERLALSRDKEGLLDLACKGQEITRPEDIIKEPLVLEFLGLPESPKLVESELETALIDIKTHELTHADLGQQLPQYC